MAHDPSDLRPCALLALVLVLKFESAPLADLWPTYDEDKARCSLSAQRLPAELRGPAPPNGTPHLLITVSSLGYGLEPAGRLEVRS